MSHGEELRLGGPCHECGGVGPVVIVQCDADPGYIGGPRVTYLGNETIVCVPSFDLWPADGSSAAPTAAGLLRKAAQLVDDGWIATEEGDDVRLRYASDLPARLRTLRAALGDAP